jgi:hypothetical protein
MHASHNSTRTPWLKVCQMREETLRGLELCHNLALICSGKIIFNTICCMKVIKIGKEFFAWHLRAINLGQNNQKEVHFQMKLWSSSTIHQHPVENDRCIHL